jgi:Cys-tRNA(Pro) deacylase
MAIKITEAVESILNENNIPNTVQVLPKSTHTADHAAKALGCEVAQIAKSLVFISDDENILLVITSGANRVDTEKLSSALNCKITLASPKIVKEQTGNKVGGVPPFGHKKKIKTILDKDLMKFEIVWAAAGTPSSVFSINPNKLADITEAAIMDVAI